VLDFTSSLYLGMTHPSSALGPWLSLTTGKPAALASAPGTAGVERDLASLQGCERATLAASTLHLMWDLFGVLAGPDTAVHVDRGTYPVALWGAERARARGAVVRAFHHHDAGDLQRSVASVPPGLRPLVATDGYCPSCGAFAPIADYLRAVRPRAGLVVVDDTQALGVFGSPAKDTPYGEGGGGSLRHLRAGGREVLVVASLAKGFGAPIAALSGVREAVAFFLSRSSTRVHSSPPSAAAVSAAAHALFDNAGHGDALRRRLADNMRRLARSVLAGGVELCPGPFPVARLPSISGADPVSLRAALGGRGIRTFVQARCRGGAELALVVRADQEPGQIDRAAAALLSVVGANRRRRVNSPDPSC
jgi:8-amino-7-oxononanoate synthase